MANNKQICTIQLQEYFQHKLFQKVIQSSHWSKLEGYVVEDIKKTLDLLKKTNTTATFFSSGWIAEKHPELLKLIVENDHEIACIGYFDFSFNDVSSSDFISDIRRAKYNIEKITNQKVLGYRAIQKPILKNQESFLSTLADEGFLYDSSIHYPLITSAFISKKYQKISKNKKFNIWEIPLQSKNFGFFHLPMGGGNALRQYPLFVKRYYQHKRQQNKTYILYFHPWELTDLQPRFTSLSALTRLRLYRNLGKVTAHIEEILMSGDFVSISEYLQINSEKMKPTIQESVFCTDKKLIYKNKLNKNEMTVVIPCYNESATIPYLKNNLDSLEKGFEGFLNIKYIFVDDCSTDNTVEKLQIVFKDKKNIKIVYHEKNKGVAGAIKTGIIESDTDLIASMDADCSYDPIELINMMNLLEPETAMVTASPYHKDGRVLGVPNWRLYLSKSLSGIYKLFLNHKFATYTACFRVYQKKLIIDSLNEWGDFRGIVELLIRLDIQGRNLKEFPTTLHCRMYGFSKMNTLKTICKHIDLLLNYSSIKKSINGK